MHGGSVAASSAGAGQGSEFVIRLPVSVERADGTEDGASVPVAEATPGLAARRRILVADDNLDALETLATLLALDGHEVYRAHDGAEAFEVAQRERPEVALLDIGMPRANGYEVAARIRGEAWGRTITLVALTGWGQDADRRRSEGAGFDLHLTKPVDPKVVSDLLAGSARRQAHDPVGSPA